MAEKLTPEEIKKALECCVSGKNCEECSLNCKAPTSKDILDLINRQQAEIERLEKENERYAELEQGCYVTGYKNIKSEAIKEFAERLKDTLATEVTVEYEIADGFFKDFFDITETFIEIDNLVKEMVGEQE